MVNELSKDMIKELKKESESWKIRESIDSIGEGAVSKQVLVNGIWTETEYRRNQFWDEQKGMYNLSTRSKSFRVFCGEGRCIDDVIKSDADFRKMFRLMNCMNESNQLMYADNKKKAVPMNKKIMSILFNMTEKKVGEFLSRMKKLNIIKEDGMGNFFINPVYTMASRGITLKVYLLFRKELEAILNENAIKDLQTLAYYDLHPEELVLAMEKKKQSLEEVLKEARNFDAINEMDNNLEPKVMTKEQEEARTVRELSEQIRENINNSSKTAHIANQVVVKEEVLLDVLQNEFNNRPVAMAISPLAALDPVLNGRKATLADLVNNCSFLQGIDLETGEVLDFVPVEVTTTVDVQRTVKVGGKELPVPANMPKKLPRVFINTTTTAYEIEEEVTVIPEQFLNM